MLALSDRAQLVPFYNLGSKFCFVFSIWHDRWLLDASVYECWNSKGSDDKYLSLLSPGLENIVCAFQIIRTRLPPGPTLVTHDDHATFRPVMPQVHEVVTRFYQRACVLESQLFWRAWFFWYVMLVKSFLWTTYLMVPLPG